MPKHSSMSTVDLSQQLRGVDFPANKKDLIKRARDNNCDESLIRELESVPDQEFTSVREIAAAMRQVSSQGEQGGRSQGRGEASESSRRHGKGER